MHLSSSSMHTSSEGLFGVLPGEIVETEEKSTNSVKP